MVGPNLALRSPTAARMWLTYVTKRLQKVTNKNSLWLAIIPYIRRIDNLRDCLHSGHFVKILGCLRAFDICSAGFFPSFALGMTSSSRTSPRANNCWLFTPNGPAHGSAPSTNCSGSFSGEYGLDGRAH
jgi:hypothetical protein